MGGGDYATIIQINSIWVLKMEFKQTHELTEDRYHWSDLVISVIGRTCGDAMFYEWMGQAVSHRAVTKLEETKEKSCTLKYVFFEMAGTIVTYRESIGLYLISNECTNYPDQSKLARRIGKSTLKSGVDVINLYVFSETIANTFRRTSVPIGP